MIQQLLFLLAVLFQIENCYTILADCKTGQSCSFLSRVDGWQIYEDLPSNSLTFPPKTDSWKHPTTKLFLTMSSYRDKLCPITLFNLFTKAEFPDRIFVGVVQQNDPTIDIDCYDTYCEMMKNDERYNKDWVDCPYKANIRMNRVDASEAKGPTWARAKGSQMLLDEEFCMQTDSHMDFVHHWDSRMMEMWALTNNEYAILSTYVADSATLPQNEEGQKGTNNAYEVPHLCMVTLGGMHGLVRNWGTKCMRNMPKPKLTNAIWGAGLSFSKCHAEKKVPYDPHTPHIFDGEEYSRAARFWTWGYDIYSPHRVFVVHNYVGSQSDPKHSGWAGTTKQQTWEQKSQETNEAVLRLKRLLEMPHEPSSPEKTQEVQRSRFGLGDRRSLDQLIQFSGIDTRNRKILPGNRCGNIDYIPFVEHPWGAEYQPKYDEVTESFQDVRDPDSVFFLKGDAEMARLWREADERRRSSNHVQLDAPLSAERAAPVDKLTAPIQEVPAIHELPPTAEFAKESNDLESATDISNVQREHVQAAAPHDDQVALKVDMASSAGLTSKSNMIFINVMCLLGISCIIAARLLFLRRSQIYKVVNSYMHATSFSSNTEENSAIKNV